MLTPKCIDFEIMNLRKVLQVYTTMLYQFFTDWKNNEVMGMPGFWTTLKIVLNWPVSCYPYCTGALNVDRKENPKEIMFGILKRGDNKSMFCSGVACWEMA